VTADQLRQKVLAEYRAASLLEFGDDLSRREVISCWLRLSITPNHAIDDQPADVIQCDVAVSTVRRVADLVLLETANLAHAEVL